MSASSVTKELVSNLGSQVYNKTPTSLKDTICNYLQEGIKKFDAQCIGSKNVKTAATQQALGAVGVTVGSLGLAGIIALGSNPVILGIGLAAAGAFLLGIGSARVFNNLKKANPQLPLYKQIYKTCTQSCKNIFFGGTKLILKCSSTLKAKFDLHVNSYQVNQHQKQIMIDEIKEKSKKIITKTEEITKNLETIPNIIEGIKINIPIQSINNLQEKILNEIKTKVSPSLNKLKESSGQNHIFDAINALSTYKEISPIIQKITSELNVDNIPQANTENILQRFNDITPEKIAEEIVEQLKSELKNPESSNQLNKISSIFNTNEIQEEIKTVEKYVTQIKALPDKISKTYEKAIEQGLYFTKEGHFDKAKELLEFLLKATGKDIESTITLLTKNADIDKILTEISREKLTAEGSVKDSLEKLEKEVKQKTLTIEALQSDNHVYTHIDSGLKELLIEKLETEKQLEQAFNDLKSKLLPISNENLLQTLFNNPESSTTILKQNAAIEIRNLIDNQYKKMNELFLEIILTIHNDQQKLMQQGTQFNSITQDAIEAIKTAIKEKKVKFLNDLYKNISNLSVDNIENFTINKLEDYNIDENLINQLATSMVRHIEDATMNVVTSIVQNQDIPA